MAKAKKSAASTKNQFGPPINPKSSAPRKMGFKKKK